MSPALAGKFYTTELPGTPDMGITFNTHGVVCVCVCVCVFGLLAP